MVCHGSFISYFSSALIKQHEQGDSKKELVCLPVGRGIATVPDGRAEVWQQEQETEGSRLEP